MSDTTLPEKKFVPKRRAPYLMQQEFIDKNTKLEIGKNKSREIKAVNNKNVSIKETDSKIFPDVQLDYNEHLSKIVGIQKRLLLYFVRCCCENKHSNTTGTVTLDLLCSVAKTTKKTLKTIIGRMMKKGTIQKVDAKRGKGGFVVFSVDKKIADLILKEKNKIT